jgi:hypothetical protein
MRKNREKNTMEQAVGCWEQKKKAYGFRKMWGFFFYLAEELLATEERHYFLDLVTCDVCQLPTQNWH